MGASQPSWRCVPCHWESPDGPRHGWFRSPEAAKPWHVEVVLS